jgi:putative transposase
MARLPRFSIPGVPQHVIVRGNNRIDIFRGEADYRFYLDKLRLAAAEHDCAIHAYVLMCNHVHLLVTPGHADSVSKAMQSLGRRYVQHFNTCYRRSGTLWEGRYRATLIQSEAHLLTCMRYIEMNPVRAGMVTRPSAYRWSSHAGNALGQADDIITQHAEYRGLGGSAPARLAAYRLLFKDRIPERELAAIRTATNKGWVLGNDRFKRRMEKQAARRVEPAPRGGDRKSADFKAARKIKRV